MKAPPAGYSGTPLPKKLGIKEEMSVRLCNAPPGFAATLGELPPGAKLRRSGPAELAIWFVRSRRDLERGIAERAEATGTAVGCGLWIAWPKKASGVATDVGEGDVRAAGLAAGLVDYKIAAIDSTWSGLKFARRVYTKRPRR